MSSIEEAPTRSRPMYALARYTGILACAGGSILSFRNQEILMGLSLAGIAGSLSVYEKSKHNKKYGNNGRTNRSFASLGGLVSTVILGVSLISGSGDSDEGYSTAGQQTNECDIDMSAVVNGEEVTTVEMRELQSTLKLTGEKRYDPGSVNGMSSNPEPLLTALGAFANDNNLSLDDERLCPVLSNSTGGYLDDGIDTSAMKAYLVNVSLK